MSITSGIVEKTVEKALADGLNELFREKKLEWTDEYRAIAEAEKKDLFASVGHENGRLFFVRHPDRLLIQLMP